jgi:hypothetical protein
MKKFIIAIVLSALLLTSCNQAMFDTTYKFDRAIIKISEEQIIEIQVKTWQDYENSDTVQIMDTNGNVYLTHYSNVVLIKEN